MLTTNMRKCVVDDDIFLLLPLATHSHVAFDSEYCPMRYCCRQFRRIMAKLRYIVYVRESGEMEMGRQDIFNVCH